MSTSHKYKLHLMEQLNTLGLNVNEPASQDVSNKNCLSSESKLNPEVSYRENDKENVSNEIQKSLKMTSTSTENGTESPVIFTGLTNYPNSHVGCSEKMKPSEGASKWNISHLGCKEPRRPFNDLLNKIVKYHPNAISTRSDGIGKIIDQNTLTTDSNKMVDEDCGETSIKELTTDPNFEKASNANSDRAPIVENISLKKEQKNIMNVTQETFPWDQDKESTKLYPSDSPNTMEENDSNKNSETQSLNEQLPKKVQDDNFEDEKEKYDKENTEKSSMVITWNDIRNVLLQESLALRSIEEIVFKPYDQMSYDKEEILQEKVEQNMCKTHSKTKTELLETSFSDLIFSDFYLSGEALKLKSSFSCDFSNKDNWSCIKSTMSLLNHLSLETSSDGRHLCSQNDAGMCFYNLHPKCISKTIFHDGCVSNSLNSLIHTLDMSCSPTTGESFKMKKDPGFSYLAQPEHHEVDEKSNLHRFTCKDVYCEETVGEPLIFQLKAQRELFRNETEQIKDGHECQSRNYHPGMKKRRPSTVTGKCFPDSNAGAFNKSKAGEVGKSAKTKKKRKGRSSVRKQQKKPCIKQKELSSSNKPAHLDQEKAKLRTCAGGNSGQAGSGKDPPCRSNQSGGGGGRERRSSGGGGNQRSPGNSRGPGNGGDDPDDHNWNSKRNNAGDKCEATAEENEEEPSITKEKTNDENDVGDGGGLQRKGSSHSQFFANSTTPSTAAVVRDKQQGMSGMSDRRSEPVLNFGGAKPKLHNNRETTRPTSLPSSPPVASFSDEQTGSCRDEQKHSVISPIQMCEILGSADLNSTVPPELFEPFDICLTKAMHNLCYSAGEFNESRESGIEGMQSSSLGSATKNASSMDIGGASTSILTSANDILPPSSASGSENIVMAPMSVHYPQQPQPDTTLPSSSLGCTVCLVVSGLLIHLSRDRLHPDCKQCAQILNLMTQHTRSCVAKNRPRQRITSSDLCYKICKKADWCAEKIHCEAKNFKGKIQKYCDKALCESTETAGELDTASALSEMGSLATFELMSTSASSSTNFSSSGKLVAAASEGPASEKPSLSSLDKVGKDTGSLVCSTKSSAITINNDSPGPFSISPAVATSVSSAAAAAASVSGVTDKPHLSLVRKSSQKARAIPQAIVEESLTPEEGSSATAVIDQNSKESPDIRDIIYKRFGQKGADPYDTQPTFGDKKGFESMPQGMLHDQEQFFSFGNRAVGVPGIGEVVFGNHKQLRLVAGFWQTKREDCERTGTNPPYQHREEGVILSQYKEYFSILRTRYQKHLQWNRVAHLGNGMSGKCHLVMDLQTFFKSCCKKVHLLKYTQEELNLWSELNHPYVVKLYGAIRHGVKIYIFCEFIDGGSLAVCIEEQKRLGQRFSHWSAINYFRQLLMVLDYLQSQNILHEDIKADNILLRKGCTYIAVADFGTCRRLCDPRELRHKSPVGSPAHWSPEKAASQGHGFPSDLWAAFCVLIHMLSGSPPWMKRFMKSATILNFIIYSREPPMEDVPRNVQPMVRNLIEIGLVKDAEKRPSPKHLLGHEAFKIVDNVKPDRFYSSLMTQNCAAPLVKPVGGEGKSQAQNQVAGNELKVLYETEISTGPYQESDTQNDNRGLVKNTFENEECLVQEYENTERTSASSGIQDEQEPEGNSVQAESSVEKEEVVSEDVIENIPTRLTEAHASPSCVPSLSDTAKGSKPKETNTTPSSKIHVPVLEDLLSSLLVPDESRAFYSDEVPNGAEALKQSSVKQQQLEVFVPEEKEADNLPHLSIFATNFSSGSSSTLHARLPSQPGAQCASGQDARRAGEEQLHRVITSGKLAEASNVSFTLSSGSEDYTSADLFDFAGPETIRNNSGKYVEAPQTQSINGAGAREVSKTNLDEGTSSLSPPASGTNLQQRKPYDLKLNVSPTSSDSTNPVFGTGGSSNDASGTTQKKRQELNWPSQPHKTPNSGRLSSSSGRLGSSTSGSRASPLPFRFNTSGSSSILEEQDRMMQMLKAEQESLSSSGSEKLNDFGAEGYYDPSQTHDGPNTVDEDWKQVLSKIQENIQSSTLEGHELVLYDEMSLMKVLPVRFTERPINKRTLVENISGRLKMNYNHFTLCHTDKKPLKMDKPLEAHELLVRRLAEPQKGCLCESCRKQF